MNTDGRSAAAGGDSPFPYRGDELVPWPLLKALARTLSGDDLFPWPWRMNAGAPTKDGGNHPSPPPGYSEAFGRATYRAIRLGSSVVIAAEGELANLNQIADIRQMPWRIYPPQFGFLVYTPQFTLPALRRFAFSEVFGYPLDEKSLVIHDLEGPHTVEIAEPTGASAASLRDDRASQTGSAPTAMGLGTSLQEAFDRAVAQLPSTPQHPDQLFTYTLLETGFMRGGFPGFRHYYAKVSVKD